MWISFIDVSFIRAGIKRVIYDAMKFDISFDSLKTRFKSSIIEQLFTSTNFIL